MKMFKHKGSTIKVNKNKMDIIELIEDACLFGGTIPKERIKEVREFLNKHKSDFDERMKPFREKQYPKAIQEPADHVKSEIERKEREDYEWGRSGARGPNCNSEGY